MIQWRQGRVTAVRAEWRGVREVTVEVTGEAGGGPVSALAYLDLVGTPVPGDRVLLNTTALTQGLGTGGHALVVAIPDRLPPDAGRAGHLVKARYTPLQVSVAGADEQGSIHHELLAGADSVAGLPTVIADLHSALPAVLAGIRSLAPAARVAYVMTDGGALPIWFSRTVSELTPALCGTVTTGQAFGGDVETVTVHTGLLAARLVLGADIAVVTQGPGNLGTGTPWGFSGVSAGEVVNAVGVLGGRAVGALRVSGADARERHFGLSHHSRTAFGRVALAPVDLVLPDSLDPSLAAAVRADLVDLPRTATLVTVSGAGLDAALRDSPVALSTMGRGLDQDYAYFLTCAAAGKHAAMMLADG